MSTDSEDEKEAPKGGSTSWVSDEPLQTFSSLTPGQRLRWLEELREWTWKAASEETKPRWARLRRGE